jgi:hypothetical protein
MKYESIEDIYAGNAKVRERLKATVESMPPEKTSVLPDGERWTIAQVLEHVAMVDEGTVKICAKLLKKAQEAGQTYDGQVVISDKFLQKGAEIATMKVEAPSFVQPSAGKSVTESLAKLDETAESLNEMRPLFESVDGTAFKFPHPFFGDITAQEWLALKGGHEMRHLKQIQRLLEKIG